MKYKSISPSWRPIDERKRPSFGQLRLGRVIAIMIFALLLLLSFSSYALPGIEPAVDTGTAERVLSYTAACKKEVNIRFNKEVWDMSKTKLPKLSLQVVSSPRGLNRIERMLSTVKNIWNLGEETYRRISAAVIEAVENAIRHGNKNDESKLVKIEMAHAGDHYEFAIEDEGSGISQPAVEGHGIRTMKKLASKLNIRRNRVELIF